MRLPHCLRGARGGPRINHFLFARSYVMKSSLTFQSLLSLLGLAATPFIPAVLIGAPPQKVVPVKVATMAAPAKGAQGGIGDLAGKPQIPCDLERLAENLKSTYEN